MKCIHRITLERDNRGRRKYFSSSALEESTRRCELYIWGTPEEDVFIFFFFASIKHEVRENKLQRYQVIVMFCGKCVLDFIHCSSFPTLILHFYLFLYFTHPRWKLNKNYFSFTRTFHLGLSKKVQNLEQQEMLIRRNKSRRGKFLN